MVESLVTFPPSKTSGEVSEGTRCAANVSNRVPIEEYNFFHFIFISLIIISEFDTFGLDLEEEKTSEHSK